MQYSLIGKSGSRINIVRTSCAQLVLFLTVFFGSEHNLIFLWLLIIPVVYMSTPSSSQWRFQFFLLYKFIIVFIIQWLNYNSFFYSFQNGMFFLFNFIMLILSYHSAYLRGMLSSLCLRYKPFVLMQSHSFSIIICVNL